MGDNLTGAGDGDDEQIKIDLSKIPANITKIAFTVTIYDAEARRQNFGQVSNAFVRIFNEVTGEEILRYDLGEDFSIETAVVFGELYKNGDEWKFNAIGSGYQGWSGCFVQQLWCRRRIVPEGNRRDENVSKLTERTEGKSVKGACRISKGDRGTWLG